MVKKERKRGGSAVKESQSDKNSCGSEQHLVEEDTQASLVQSTQFLEEVKLLQHIHGDVPFLCTRILGLNYFNISICATPYWQPARFKNREMTVIGCCSSPLRTCDHCLIGFSSKVIPPLFQWFATEKSWWTEKWDPQVMSRSSGGAPSPRFRWAEMGGGGGKKTKKK